MNLTPDEIRALLLASEWIHAATFNNPTFDEQAWLSARQKLLDA